MSISDVLTNRTVEGFSIGEHGFCCISLSDGYSLAAQTGLLRYVGNADTFVSSMDHGHQFGLPAPFDAEHEIRKHILNKPILSVKLAASTGDLTLRFDDGCIEIICTSAGYEAYE